MKKNLFKIALGVAVIATSFSSCTKEQTSLNLLKGTWNLDASYDGDGDLIDPTEFDDDIQSVTTEYTFFQCNGKENEACTGVTKTTTTYNDGTDTDYSAGEFSYEVHDKTYLVFDNGGFGGTVYEIEELTKKAMVIHPVSAPLAKREFSKSK